MKNIALTSFIFLSSSCTNVFPDRFRENLSILSEKDFSSKKILAEGSLSGILSKEYYLVKASFQENDSKLILFSHFQGFHISDGIQVQMERAGNSLTVKLAVQDHPPRSLFQKADYFSDNNELDMTVGVENGTNYGFRVWIWENFSNKKNGSKIPSNILTKENLLVDSLLKKLTFYNKGQGLKWGIQLIRVRLLESARVTPRLL